MKKDDFVNPKIMKLLIPMVVVLGVIVIFKGGFKFGQWLFALLH